MMFLEWFCDVSHHEMPDHHPHSPAIRLGLQTQERKKERKKERKTSTWQCCCGVGRFSATICRQYVSSGKNIFDSGNTCTTHNQQLHWDALRRWWLNLSLSLSLFIPIFCVLPVSLRDCLYCEKDVVGALCHGHISCPSENINLRLSRTHKKRTENLANTFFDALAILKKNCRLKPANIFRIWQVQLAVTSSTWQISQLDKLTCHPALLPLFKSLDKL